MSKKKECLVYQAVSDSVENHVRLGNCQAFPTSIWGVIVPVTLNAERDLATSLFIAQNTQFVGATVCHPVGLVIHSKNQFTFI